MSARLVQSGHGQLGHLIGWNGTHCRPYLIRH